MADRRRDRDRGAERARIAQRTIDRLLAAIRGDGQQALDLWARDDVQHRETP